MKVGTYVEFTGILPLELQKIKRSKKDANKKFKGTVVKKIGKTKAEVKPKYRRFTVVVRIADITQIKESAFSKKRKSPSKKAVSKKTTSKITTKPKLESKPKLVKKKPVIKKKPAIKKVEVKGDGPVKVVPKPNASKMFKDEVSKKIESDEKKAEKPISEKEYLKLDRISSEKPSVTPKEFPLNSEAVEKMPKKEVKEDYNWATDDPINTCNNEQGLIDEQQGGGLVIYIAIGLVLAAAIGTYFYFL